jgi:hypothetical protein
MAQTRIMEMAEKQIEALQHCSATQIEWRVFGEDAAEALGDFLKFNGIDEEVIKVVHVP